jgi:hypothetical protein
MQASNYSHIKVELVTKKSRKMMHPPSTDHLIQSIDSLAHQSIAQSAHSEQAQLLLLLVLLLDHVRVSVLPVAFAQFYRPIAHIFAVHLLHGPDEVLKITGIFNYYVPKIDLMWYWDGL